MTVVVIPTYNERENVAAMSAAVLSNLTAGDALLFVDDGSPDGTGDLVEDLAKRDGRIRCLHRKTKEGLGRAYVAGFREALALGADRVIQMDCDFSHDPNDIPRLLACDADVVIGSRYVKGGKTVGWPFKRKLISKAGGVFIKVMTGMPIADPTGGFKCFNRKALEMLDLDTIRSGGYSFQLEMNHRAWRNGMTIEEVPITFRERVAGYSKITAGIAVESVKIVMSIARDAKAGCGGLVSWIGAIRVEQWTKNFVVMMAWFFAAADATQAAKARGVVPFALSALMALSFCLVSSCFYLLNDISDYEDDRKHPVKKSRPIASGTISKTNAVKVALLFFALGLVYPSTVIMVWPMRVVAFMTILAYVILQCLYSGFLKHVPYLDVMMIAIGFVLRAVAGAAVIDARISSWLLLCTFLLALFLGFCKRRHEMVFASESRKSLKRYNKTVLDVLIVGVALVTLGAYVAYTLSGETVMRFGTKWIVASALFVALGLARYLSLVYSKADVGRPERVLLTDRKLWLVIVGYALTVLAVLLCR